MGKEPMNIHTDTTGGHTTYTGVDPYDLGYNTAIEEIQKYLEALGEALCFLMELVPNRQLSVTWNVSEECELKFTVSKEV